MEPPGAAGPAGQRHRGCQRKPNRACRRPADGPARTADRAPYVRRSDGLDGCRRHPVQVPCASASPMDRSPGACPYGRGREPIDPERANRAQLDYLAWVTGTVRSRSARAPGTPARARPSVPTMPATCSWWSWPGEARPCDHAPAHRTARLASAGPRSHQDRRPWAALDQLLAGVTGSERGVVQLASLACSTWSLVRRWKPRSTAGRANSTLRSATSWWPSPARVTSSASVNRR